MARLRAPGPGSPAWVAAETVAQGFFALIGLLFVARIIGPHEAGIGAVAASAFLTVDFPISALFGDSLLQRKGLEERHRASALWATIAVALLGTLALALAAPAIAAATDMPPLREMIPALALLLPVSAVSGMLSALALRDRRYRLLAGRVLVCQPLAIGAGILVAKAGGGAWAMAAQQAVATLSVFALVAARARWRPSLRFDRMAIAELWPVAGPQILALLVLNGRYRIFIVALGMAATETVVAVTHIAFRLLDVATAVVAGATSRLAMPRLAALQSDRVALAEAYGDLAELQALVGLPVAAGLAITAPQLVELLMGGAWSAAAEPARLVAAAAIPAFLVGPAPALWLAVGRTRINLLMQLIAFVVPIAALALLQPRDPTTAALCWVGGSLAVPPVQAAMSLRLLGRSIGWMAERLLVPVIATAGMAVVALWSAAATVQHSAVVSLLVIGGSGAAAYVAIAAVALGGRWPRALQHA